MATGKLSGYPFGSAFYTVEVAPGKLTTVVAQSPCDAVERCVPGIMRWRWTDTAPGKTLVNDRYEVTKRT